MYTYVMICVYRSEDILKGLVLPVGLEDYFRLVSKNFHP